MQNFTPWSSLAGGALIGLSAALLYLVNGRIAGISGIFNGVLRPKSADVAWRVLFLGGLILGSFVYSKTIGLPFALREGFPIEVLALAGFLVGMGTKMGNGCTSGHGVCGVARLSWRSIAATVVFLATGMLTTTFIAPYLIGAAS